MWIPIRWAVFAIPILFAVIGALSYALSQEDSTVSTEVRINARQLTDGRVEFALQQRDDDGWGERMLVPSRILPAEVGHSRWLSSGPFTIEIEAPESQVPELMEEEPTAAPETDVVSPFDNLGNPPTLADWNLAPLLPTALYSYTTSGVWTVWQIPRSGLPVLYATCAESSGLLFQLVGSTGWAATKPGDLLALAVNLRSDAVLESFVQELNVLCDVNAREHLPTKGVESAEQPVGGPPDWRPIRADANWVNGNYTYMRLSGDGSWMVLQMRRVNGDDVYVACQSGIDALQSKTEGGDWSPTTFQRLPNLFSFAPWYFAAAAVQEIGTFCGVARRIISQLVGSISSAADQQQQQQSTTTTTPTAQEPITRTASGTATMSNSNHPAIIGTDRIVIRWSSRRPSSWSASIRIIHREGTPIRKVLEPGPVVVSVGARTFIFTVEDHSHGRSFAGYVNRVYPPGTEAVLSGSSARDFYCAARGSSIGLSLPLHNPPETHITSVQIREINPGHGIDLCE